VFWAASPCEAGLDEGAGLGLGEWALGWEETTCLGVAAWPSESFL
jgi:hypothetical protein